MREDVRAGQEAKRKRYVKRQIRQVWNPYLGTCPRIPMQRTQVCLNPYMPGQTSDTLALRKKKPMSSGFSTLGQEFEEEARWNI